VKKLVLEATPL
jgi:cation transport regulator